jgi:uncharacterized protein involved in oxidation of intracellular sulfur
MASGGPSDRGNGRLTSGHVAVALERALADARSMKVLLILDDAPYGTERAYNGLRLALALAKVEGTTVGVFLMADAVACAKPGQMTPDGFYNIGRMLKGLTTKGVEVGACGSCMDARGFTDADLAEGICRSSMPQLAQWTLAADKVVTF